LFRKNVFALAITFSVSAQAFPFFKEIPESKAHVVYGSARDSELKSDSIHVLVWNIKKTQERPWKEEFSAYSRGKDLLLIQEAYDSDRFLDTITSYEGYRWDMGKSFLYTRYANHATGTMIGSTAEPEEVIVSHTSDHEPITHTPKTLTYAKYGLEGSDKSLLVVSVHAINFRELAPFKRNMEQIKAQVEKHEGPVLVAGDFNTYLKSRTNFLMNLMKSLNLTAVKFLHADERLRAPVTGYFLDHAFVRGLSVKFADVDGNSHGSDHKPLILELAVED
jgi:endonuclease/exonuclease/phosphatase (EEP) superfamily protein YafD